MFTCNQPAITMSAVLLLLGSHAAGNEITVAPHSAPIDVKEASGIVCSGTQDEESINRAIASLSRVAEETVLPGPYHALGLTQADGWAPVQAGTSMETVAASDGGAVMKIRNGSDSLPGVVRTGEPFNLSSFEALEIFVRSNSAIKVRVVLTDQQGDQVRYHEKVPAPGDWRRLRFFLNQPYRGAANLSTITEIQIAATTDLNECEFALSRAAFVHSVPLANDRIHPGSIAVSRGGADLVDGVDYQIDLRRGVIWLSSPSQEKVLVRYRHGGGIVNLLPGQYHISSPSGIQLQSYCHLELEGAILNAPESYESPGCLIQTPTETISTDITVTGGLLRGNRMKWSPLQNHSGIVIRDTSGVRIEGCEIVDFNGVGLAVLSSQPTTREPVSQRVKVLNNRIARCATEYVDIRGDKYAAVGKGNDHKAMLRLSGVRDFEIRDNRIEDSFGDAKWVVHCKDGMISGNAIENSRMGSYFVEDSVRVIGVGNLIRNAGSRAVTIERGSHENTFANNLILNSYREGLWLMGCSECIVEGNRFENTGWRNEEERDSAIKVDWQEKFGKHKASDNLIVNNIFKLQPHQDQAVWITSGEHTQGNVVTDNIIIGATKAVRDDGSETIIERNHLR